MTWTYATWARSLHLQSLWLPLTSSTALDLRTIISRWHNHEVNYVTWAGSAYPPESAVAFNSTCVISSHPFGTIISTRHNHEENICNMGWLSVSTISTDAFNLTCVISSHPFGTLFPYGTTTKRTYATWAGSVYLQYLQMPLIWPVW